MAEEARASRLTSENAKLTQEQIYALYGATEDEVAALSGNGGKALEEQMGYINTNLQAKIQQME